VCWLKLDLNFTKDGQIFCKNLSDKSVLATFEQIMSLSIRFATIKDVNLISVLGITANYEAYFELDPSHDLADYCLRVFSEQSVKSDLDNPNLIYLIAEYKGNAVGFALIREGKKVKCLENKNAIEIQRIYVIGPMKGKGIGKALIEKCCEIGRKKGYETIWLGVWDKNVEAQKFYQKIGMENVGLTDFSDGKNKFINLVFAKEL
jgi:ribosomal protein S18 acetylase RimI-like enzyme